MAIELVTGRKGFAHVDSADDGALRASLFGTGTYILSGCKCTITSSNSVHVSAGEILAEGRHVRIKGVGEDVTIENGASTYSRNDIIALHYIRDTDNIENMELVVIKGEPVDSDPEDPEMPTVGSILDGSSDVYIPLFRVVIVGLTPTEIVTLVTDYSIALQFVFLLGVPFISREPTNPAEKFGGVWEYDESTHMLNGWYIYYRIG